MRRSTTACLTAGASVNENYSIDRATTFGDFLRKRKSIVFTLFFIVSSILGYRDLLAQLQTIDFETTAGYTTTEFIVTTNQFWKRFDKANEVAGTGTDDHSLTAPVTGVQGNFYFASEDIDSGPGNLERSLLTNALSVIASQNLEARILVAAPGTGYDASQDYLIIEYSYDGAIFTKIGQFSGNAGAFQVDTDMNGIGDGTTLTLALTEYTFVVPKLGTSLQIRVRGFSSGGGEEIVFDNLRVLGIPTTDVAAPTLVITRNPVTLGTGFTTTDASVSFNLAFNEIIDNATFTVADITVNNPGGVTFTALTGGSLITSDNQNYTLTVSGITAGDGTLGITVGPAISDLSANAMAAAQGPSSTFIIDNTATVSIGAPSATNANPGSSVTYTITYTGADAVSLVNGNVSLNTTGGASASLNVTGSGTATRTVTLTSFTGNGTVGISLVSATATDLAGNTFAAAGPSATINVDTNPPTVSVGAPSQANANSAATVTFLVTYSGATTINLTNGNVTLNGPGTPATINVTNGTTATPTVTLTGLSGNGALGITIAANTSSDLAGNQNLASAASTTFTVDNLAPTTTPTEPDMQAASDLGVSTTDDITSDNTPAFDGTAATGDIVTLNSNIDGNVGSVTVSGGTYNGLVARKARTGTITCTTGSSTVTSPAVNTLFTTELTVGQKIYNAAGTLIGTISAIGSNTSLTLTGNAAVAVTAAGYSTGLSDGTHTITAIASDLAGNTVTSDPFTPLVIDTDPPAIVSITPIQTPTRGIIAMPGSISATSTVATVTTTDAQFLTNLFIGARIRSTTDADIGQVLSIESQNSLTLTVGAANSLAGAYALRFYSTATFDEPMNSSTITSADFIETGDGTLSTVAAVTQGNQSTAFKVHVSALLGDNTNTRIDLTADGYQDVAGNSANAPLNGTQAITDNTAPTFTARTPANNAYVTTANVGYTITEANGALTSGTVTWAQTGGTVDLGSPHNITLTGTELNTGVRANAALTNGGAVNLIDGAEYTVSYSGTDAAGNTTAPTSNTLVTVDETPPSPFLTQGVVTTGAPVVANYWNADNTSVTVTVDIENEITLNGGNIQLQGRVTPAGTFANVGGTTAINGTDLTNGTKNVSITDVQFEAIASLVDGSVIELRAVITDRAGNSTPGAASTTLLTVDRIDPAVSNPNLVAGTDTGPSSTDDYTNDDTPDFDGTAEAAAFVELLDGGAVRGSFTATGGGAWGPITATTIGTGASTMTARATDAAGNVGTSAGSLIVTVDQIVPPAITAGNVTTATVGGTLRTGYWNSTNTSLNISVLVADEASNSQVNGTIQIQARTSVQADVSFSNLGTAVNIPSDNSTQAVNILSAVLEAPHPAFAENNTMVFRAIITDRAGNTATSANSTSTRLVDQTLPTAGAMTLTPNGAPSNSEVITWLFSEYINIDGDNPPVADDGDTGMTGFTITNGGGAAISTQTYEYDPSPGSPTPLQGRLVSATDGWVSGTTVGYTSAGNITDLAGNEMADFSGASLGDIVDPFLITGMVFNPNGGAAETITFRLSEPLSLAEGAVLGFKVSQPGANTVATAAYSGKNSTETITLTSPGNGTWTDAITVSYVLADGNATDGAGRELTVITNEPILLNTINIVSSNTNPVSGTLAKPGDIITLTFTAARTLAANPTVTIGTPAQAATFGSLVGSIYTYTYNTTPNVINDGAIAISITADETGPPAKQTIASVTTNASSVTYDKIIPIAPPNIDFGANNPPIQDTGTSQTDNYTKTNSNLYFSGTGAEANSTIELFDSGSSIAGASTTADGTGAWNITVPAMADGIYVLTVKSTDAAGNISAASSALLPSLTIDNTPPNVVSILRVNPPPINGWSTTNGTSASSVTFRVTFDEEVTGIDLSGGGGGGGSSSFQRNFSGTVAMSAFGGASFTTSNFVDITVNGISGTGQLSINYLDKDNVVNLVGDPVGGVGPGNGSFFSDFSPLNEYYTVVLPEPTASVTAFGQSTTTTSVTVNWSNAAIPTTQATHYLVRLKKSTSSFSPVSFTDGITGGIAGDDGVNYTDTDFSDGTLAAYLNHPSSNHTFTGLSSGTQYNIEVYPLTYTLNYGTDNWNYKFSAPLTGNTTTGVGTQTTIAPLTVAPTISSFIDTPGEIFDVFTFQIRDDGSSPLADVGPFKFSALTIVPNGFNGISDWTQALGGASLTASVGGTITGTVQYNIFAVNTSSIVFNAGTSDDATDFGFIADDQVKTYTLSLWLKPDMDGALNLPAIIDGLRFGFLASSVNFTLENSTGSQASSQFFAGTAAQSGSAIAVDVDASKLVFAASGTPGTNTNPQASIGVATPFSSSAAQDPEVYALDANNNLDLDYETASGNSGAISNTQSLVQSVASLSFTNGVLTLNPLSFTTAGINTQLIVAGVGAPAVTSATSTNVTAVISNTTTISDATVPALELASFTSLTTALPASHNFDFTITDDVGVDGLNFTDNDGLPTRVQNVTITQSTNNGTNGGGDVATFDNWTLSIAGAQLTDGTSSVTIANPSANITGSTLVFNVAGTSMETVPNNGPKTYQLRIWLRNPVDATLRDILDNKDFAFAINQGNLSLGAANTTSTMAASSTSTGDGRNVVTVAATQLDFITQWAALAAQNYDAALSPNPTAKARDANQNLDIGFNAATTVTAFDADGIGPKTYPLSNAAVTVNNGNITFNASLLVNSSGNGINGDISRLILASTGLTSANSNSFILNYSGNSDIVRDGTFTHPTDIQFINNREAINLTAANSIALDRFLLREGGASNDADGSKTKLQSITLNITNHLNIRRIGLYDESNVEIQELDSLAFSAGGNITFSTFSNLFEANDDDRTTKRLTVRASFRAFVTDNQQMNVSVTAAAAGGVSSQLVPISIAGDALGTDKNKIEVVATKIDFTTVPGSASISVPIAPPTTAQIIVSARDVFANLDLDYNGTITATETNPSSDLLFHTLNDPTGAFSSGQKTYPATFQFDVGDGNVQLTINSGAGSGAANVNAAAITGTSPVINVFSSFESTLTSLFGSSFLRNINYINYQAANITGAADGFKLDSLQLRDGGTDLIDADGAATMLDDLTLGISNPQSIQKIAIYTQDPITLVVTEIQEQANAAITVTNGYGQITFNNLNITAPDNKHMNIWVLATFNNTASVIQDRDTIQVSVLAATLATGSKFAPDATETGTIGGVAFSTVPFPPAATSIQTGSIGAINRLQVIATSLDFVTQPSDYAGILEPIDGSPGASAGGSTGIVHARDLYAVIDTDFNYSAGVSAAASPFQNLNPFTFVFNNGILNLTGMQYGNSGLGTLTVLANGLNSNNEPWGTSERSEVVDAIHVTAIAPQNPANGVIGTNSLKGGTSNIVIFGFDIFPTYATAAEPDLKGFSIIFDTPFKTSSTTIFKNFKVFESAVGAYSTSNNVTTIIGTTIVEGQSPGLVTVGSRDMVTITFPPGSYRSLRNRTQSTPLTYFLVVDVDATANISTPELTPQLRDGGYYTPTNASILTTAGSSSANVIGTQFSFASTNPPILASSVPANGALNVDSLQSTIQLTFNVGVWSHDQYILLYERSSNQLIDTLKLTPLTNGFYPGPVAGSPSNPAPLSFTVPFPDKFIPDSVYYITIAKGTFDPNTGTGTGISDDGFNLYGGISFNGGLYFKIASKKPPVMLSTNSNKYYPSPTGASVNASFDQKEGTAYYMVVNQGNPTPTNNHINGSDNTYSGTAVARGLFAIDQVAPNLNTETFTIAPSGVARTFDVWMYAENGAPVPVATLAPYGKFIADAFTNNDFVVGAAGPTFSVDIPAASSSIYLNRPIYQICSNSTVTLIDPIIIEESNARNEFSGGVQNFNLLLPVGFTFDVNTAPLLQSSGGLDFDQSNVLNIGQFSYQYVNSTILRIRFTNTGNASHDKMIVSNLKVTASAPDLSGSIIRFAGNAFPLAPASLGDGALIAGIASNAAAALSFNNSYTTANSFNDPPISIVNTVTAIPDNYVDPNPTLSPLTVRLFPTVPKGDYGPSTFSGTGITDDILSLSGVPLNSAFTIIMTHVDLNGCISAKPELYEVYDHTRAMPALVDATYGTKDFITNPSYLLNLPPAAFTPALNPADTISRYFKAGYNMIELFANIPARVTAFDSANVALNTPTSQIMFGPAWQNLVRQIPEKKDSTENIALSEFYRSYYWYYGILMPLSSTLDPYKYFDAFTPEGRKYFKGGSLGLVEFTGKFRSTADATVQIPIRQEIEIFIPAIPVVEIDSLDISGYDIADPLRPNPLTWQYGTPIVCQNGANITISGYPAATAGVSAGYFDIVDALNSADTLYSAKTPAKRYGGFLDNGNGTATLSPGVLKNSLGEFANLYKDIRIVYTYKDNASPIKGSGDLVIRISPNPQASFSANSVLLSDNIPGFNATTISGIANGRPASALGYCEDNYIYFTNTTQFLDQNNLPVSGYIPQTNPVWTMGDPLNPRNTRNLTTDPGNASLPDSVIFKYNNFGKYDVTFSVASQYNCPSAVATAPIYVGVIPTPNFEMNGISTATPVNVKSTTSISSSNSYPKSDTLTSLWYFGEPPVADPAAMTYAAVNNYNYTTPGHYVVTLKAVTQITTLAVGGTVEPGCEISYQRPVIIVPAINSTAVGAQLTDDFEDPNSLAQWQTDGTYLLNDVLVQGSSWARGVASKDSITSATNVWVTGVSTNYDTGEVAYLYSSAFDISLLQRPMVSFSNWVYMNQRNSGNDGVVLDFSTDTLNVTDPDKKWYRFGISGEGKNWYDRQGLASKPGSQLAYGAINPAGDFGWGSEGTGWVKSIHSLSPDVAAYPGARTRVILRFALASVGNGDQGMAIDSFRIGERTRIILVENFSNLGSPASSKEKAQSDFLQGNFNGGAVVGRDFVKLVYHVGFPQPDPFNLDSPADPSARALYYNVATTPYARLDGFAGNAFQSSQNIDFSNWGKKGFDDRTLELARAKLRFIEADTTQDGAYKAQVRVTAIDSLPTSTILHIVLAEKQVMLNTLSTEQQTLINTGETTFEYVVKKMLPSALGTKFTKVLNPLVPADSAMTFPLMEWTPDNAELYGPTNDMVIIAFLQNEITREVYQAIMSPLIPDPPIVTGIEDPDYAKKINLFPNPANHEVNIQLPAAVSKATPVAMFDTYGRMVYEGAFKTGEQTKTVSTTELAGGIYFIQISTPDGNIARRKVMVIHH